MMIRLGIDMGASTVKLALLQEETREQTWVKSHQGNLLSTLRMGLEQLAPPGKPIKLAVTGSNSQALLEACPALYRLEDIPAIVEGVRYLAPQAGSVIEIGSQSARFITDLQGTAPRFCVNEHCAGGTGSFFEDQMLRRDPQLQSHYRQRPPDKKARGLLRRRDS